MKKFLSATIILFLAIFLIGAPVSAASTTTKKVVTKTVVLPSGKVTVTTTTTTTTKKTTTTSSTSKTSTSSSSTKKTSSSSSTKVAGTSNISKLARKTTPQKKVYNNLKTLDTLAGKNGWTKRTYKTVQSDKTWIVVQVTYVSKNYTFTWYLYRHKSGQFLYRQSGKNLTKASIQAVIKNPKKYVKK
ncbi:hypothetical protein IKG02_03115 [Candidatus Saccharibacteria bacterium]|nr:hypothetical protein [Candidatus Saccharibacteria bacterium]